MCALSSRRWQVNFGQEPFLFDLDAFLQEEASSLFRVSEPIPLPPRAVLLVVRDYLLTHGYAKTLASLDLHQPPKGAEESTAMTVEDEKVEAVAPESPPVVSDVLATSLEKVAKARAEDLSSSLEVR